MEFDEAVAQLATLVETLERDGDDRALLLLGLMDDIHRPALELIVEGHQDHPVATALLSMYGLAPIDQRIEAEEALDEIRPYIEGHGGALELVDVEDGIISVRMSGACNGCAASAMTLRRGIEGKLRERLDWFKEVVALEPEGEPDAAPGNGAITLPLLQIEPLAKTQNAEATATVSDPARVAKLRRPVFVEVGASDDLQEGKMMAVEVDGHSVMVLKLDGEPYAFANVCPAEGGRLPLAGGRLTDSVIVCPWHNCAYDARSGKRVDDAPNEPSLAVLPITVIDGVLQVAATVA
jgi:Fe-S cluster biogenesis protein NfuA/nitrite reductase/ring-hydroxylating ferredoxin subunit